MAKKTFGSQDNPILDGAEKAEAAGRPTLRQVDEATFGGGIIPESGKQIAKPISLGSITPDPTQPRREVPQTVRRRAKEQGIPEWEQWHQVAEYLSGKEIPLASLLRGEGEASEEDKTGIPLVDGFMALVALAASINRDGLANPITVTSRGASPDNQFIEVYQIETGERRYQAFKLLYGALDDEKFAKIPARVVDKTDVWRQAAENGSRKPLNAIGMARQTALLIMALNGDKTYRPFDDFESEREFYAQVADGTVHRIPKGMSERILQATGLKSKSDLSHYRALLDIPDDVWSQADEDNWTENRIREHILTLKNPDRLTTRQPMTETDVYNRPVQPPGIKKGEGAGTPANPQQFQLLYGRELVEYVDSTPRKPRGLDVTIWHLDRSNLRTWSEVVNGDDLTDIPYPDAGKPTGGFPSPAAPFVQPKVSYDAIGPNATTRLEKGQKRQSPAGKIFEILSVTANEVSVVEISPTTGRPISSAYGMHISAVSNMPLVTDTRSKVADDEETETSDQSEVTGGNPSSTQGELPEWADRGKFVVHVPSGTVCEVVATVVDAIEDQWYLRVKTGEGDWGDLPLSECQPTEAKQMPPHPGMRAENANSVITQEQFKLSFLWKMAADLNMQTEAAMIQRMKVLTPLALDAFIRQGNADEQIEAMYEAGRAVLTAMFQALQEVQQQAVELLRQKRGA
jgi:hypothetical protein